MATAHGARRAAALAALCLLSLAAGASAACDAGYLKLDLVDTASKSHEFSKCLSSLKINIDIACDITLESLSFGGSYVPDMWSSATTYASWAECPQLGTKVVTTGADGPTEVVASIVTAFSQFVYGSTKVIDMKTSGAVAFTAGKVVVTTKDDAQIFTYAITERTLTAAQVDAGAVVVATTGALPANGATTISGDCLASEGRYGFVVGSIKVCPFCPTGTYGDGVGCTACAAGKASASVGAVSADCTDCSKGTYSVAGTSVCQPCPMHTYSSTTAASSCTSCPTNSYAWIPGSAGCVRCSAGIPKCVEGDASTMGAACDYTGTASEGYHVLDVTNELVCALTGDYLPPATDVCTTWKSNAPALQLSLWVKGDCSIVVSPISEAVCANPLKSDYAGGFTYGQLQMRAYYQTLSTIRSLLPSASTGYSSSYMLAIDADATTNVDVTFWGASTDPSKATAAAAAGSCTTKVAVTGGQVAGLPSTPDADCPAGSYKKAGAYCPACPTGNYCLGGTGDAAVKVECAADKYNSILGLETNACTACPDGGSVAARVAAPDTYPTSLVGAYSCTIPFVQVNCDAGYEYEPASQKCIQCKAGTARAADYAGGCVACAAGEYSAVGASVCVACPAGQYGPSEGLGDQTAVSGIKCLRCPAGSLAVQTGDDSADVLPGATALSTGATKCQACPAGHYMSSNTALCSVCPINKYRSGDATPENNVCLDIPAGYRADPLGSSDTGVTDIKPCPVGDISYYSSSIRQPVDTPRACQACTLNTYAPRVGMANCLPCDGGTVPDSDNKLCVACDDNKYRSFANPVDACDTCGAGAEVGPSSKQACTQCRPGTYKAASGASSALNFCTDCDTHHYSPLSGAEECLPCPVGTEALSTGSSECTPCSVGYYNPVEGAACVAAPAGSYVNTSEATSFSACSVGTFSTVTGADQCDPCPPGQFTNIPGSKSCRTCPSGTYSLGKAPTCTSCRAGFYAPAGAAACSACKPGTFSKTTRSATCSLCPAGSQCSGIATTAPTLCPKGYFSAKEGSKLCTPCPVNTFQADEGRTSCGACDVGTSTRGQVGQSICQATRPASLRRSMA